MTCAAEQEIPAPEPGEQGIFMERFRQLYTMADPALTLTNIYKEMPITHPASICEVKGHHLELCTCELQLAAISLCREVYLRSPHLDWTVLGRLYDIDIRRGLVQLKDFSRAELNELNRRTVRVRFKKPTSIVMHSGSDKISGVIHDISLGGCCINTLVRKETAEPGGIQIELKLIDPATGQLSSARIPGDIVSFRGDAPPFKCALSFRHTQQTEQFLSSFIYQRQLEILKELREKL